MPKIFHGPHKNPPVPSYVLKVRSFMYERRAGYKTVIKTAMIMEEICNSIQKERNMCVTMNISVKAKAYLEPSYLRWSFMQK